MDTIFNWQHLEILVGGTFLLRFFAFAMKTCPKPKSVWGLWVVGCLQWFANNLEEAQVNFKEAKLSTTGSNQIPGSK